MGSPQENAVDWSMKRLGLSRRLLSATLFLGCVLSAAPAPDAAKAASPPATATPDGAATPGLLERFYLPGDVVIEKEGGSEIPKVAKLDETNLPPGLPETTPGPGAGWQDRLLAMFDRNNDGRLDESERAAAQAFAVERGLMFSEEQRQALLERFDRNGNGRIDDDERPALQEFLRERMGREAAPPPNPAAELENALRATVESQVGLRGRYDTDLDGRLSDEEWAAARLRIAQVLTAPENERRRQQEIVETLMRRRREQDAALSRGGAAGK